MKQVQGPAGLFRLLCIAAALVLGCHGVARSAEPKPEKEIQNIGFMKNPPPELKARFPMCEEFLDVQWLDKKYMVGYSMYDVYVKKPVTAPAVRKRFYAIVAIPFGVPAAYNFDAYQYAGKGRLKELFELIKSADNLGAGFLAFSVWKDGKRVDFHLNDTMFNYGEIRPLLSDYRKTVCIGYPAGDRAWIIEGKTVGKTYTEDQVQELFNSLKTQDIKIAFEVFKRMWILDVNGDGIDDYFMPRALIHSVGNQMRITGDEFKYPNFIFSFPGTGQACSVDKTKMNFDLTTDGKSYFASGCNWTELSSMK